MTCYYPLLGVQEGINKNGKRPVRIFASSSEMDRTSDPGFWKDSNVLSLPCGKCIGCRLDYARTMAIRCYHESTLHDLNCFITLTYNEENIPNDRSINKRELQLFIKRYRKSIEPTRIRYFACGEYGERFDRPHYHLLIFGHDFDDKEIFKIESKPKGRFSTSDSHILYISKSLDKLWTNSKGESKGFSTLGSVTLESAGYVARYSVVKISGNMASDHYQGKEPEFGLMSRRPGIGKDFLLKYPNDFFPKDFITVNGYKHKPPKYYIDVMEGIKPDMISKLKSKRKEYATSNIDNRKRLLGKNKYQLEISKNKEKKYDKKR